METIKIEAYFPIVSDLPFEKYPFEQKDIILKEIEIVTKMVEFEKEFFQNPIIEVNTVDGLSQDLLVLYFKNSITPMLLMKSKFLYFSLSIDVDLNKSPITSIPENRSQEGVLIDWKVTALEIFKDKIFEIIIVSQIARPGGLKLSPGIIFYDKWEAERMVGSGNMRESYEYSKEIGYPKVDFLELPKVYKWFIENDLMFPLEPKSSLQKALNAFSYVFDSKSIHYNLLYIMMALETLFTKGNQNITSQLNDKIQIFLGEMNDYKTRLKKMYSSRSQLFHGELPIPPSYKSGYYDSTKFEKELIEAEALSKMILISTFQTMYKKKIQELEFGYYLKEN